MDVVELRRAGDDTDKHEMVVENGKMFVNLKRKVVVLIVTITLQMAVYSPFSVQIGPS